MPDADTHARFRLFVAIAVPEEVKASILKTQESLRKLLPEPAARWTRPEQFHLTLRFLGNVEASQVKALEQALRGACAGFNALRLRAARIGFFPSARSPRVVWVGVADDQERLSGLWSVVQSATSAFTTAEPEEKFAGHITLARIKLIPPREARELAAQADQLAATVFGEWTATEVEIIWSQLSSQGARYNTVAAVPLQ